MDYEKIYETAYSAFKKALDETGDDYKSFSWFARNKQTDEEDVVEYKEAA